MKIKKIKKLNGAVILNDLANALANANLDKSQDPLGDFSELGYTRRLASLDPENVNPIFSYEKVFPGTRPTAGYINRACSEALIDIQALFGISGSLGNALLESNNLIVRREESLLSSISELRSALGTLRLYNGAGSSTNIYKRQSFERQSELMPLASGEAECSVSFTEGCLTLPVSSSGAETIKIDSLFVSEASQGLSRAGLQWQTFLSNSALGIVQDGNEQTWIEFEAEVEGGVRRESCVLVLEVNFAKPEILNRIIFRPVNFGTQTWVKVDDIRGSISSSEDAEAEISIKDDLISAEWGVDELSLSSADSSDPSIGQYTFTPKVVRRVVMTFRAQVPPGTTEIAKIGIRELKFQRVPFESVGEFKLQPMDFGQSGKSVLAAGVLHNLLQRREGVTEAVYSISADSGETWHKLTALTEANTAIGEVTDFKRPSSKLLVKGRLERSLDSFSPSSPGGPLLTDLLTAAPSVTNPISLTEKPVSHLEVSALGVGTVGLSFPPEKVGEGVAPNGVFTKYPIPYTIPRHLIKVLVDGVEWERVLAFSDTETRAYQYDDSSVAPRLIFGNGVDPNGGRAIPPGAAISVYTSPEKPEVTGSAEEGYIGHLKLPSARANSMLKVFHIRGLGEYLSSKSPDNFNIFEIAGSSTSKIIDLPKERIYVAAFITSPNARGENPWIKMPFIDGRREFDNVGGFRYSLDDSECRLYLSSHPPTNPDGSLDMNIRMGYLQKIEIIKKSFIEGADSFRISDSVYNPSLVDYIIKNRQFRAHSSLDENGNEVESDHTYLVLDAPVVEGSIRLRKTTGPFADAMRVEVPYIDGSTEFLDLPTAIRDSYFSVNYKTDVGAATPYAHPELSQQAGATIHRFKGFNELRNAQDLVDGTIGGDEENGFTFLSSDILVSYRMGQPLRNDADYSTEDAVVNISSSWILENKNRDLPDRDILVTYDISTVPSDGGELERFYSPILRDFALIGATVDPRLAGIASL